MRTCHWIVGFLAAGVFVLSGGATAEAGLASSWRAGGGRGDPTPTTPVRVAGYALRAAASPGVARPRGAKALVLADQDDHKVVIVTCDIIGFRRAFTNRVVDRVKAKHGIARENIVLFASHNHAGPSLSEAAADPTREGVDSNVQYTRELE